MKKVSTTWIIHGFAVLHAAATICCTLLGIKDSLFLTILTMTMTILICYGEKLTVEITIASIVLVNILGFLLGNLGALFVFDQFPPVWQHSLSTFIVTELLGWGLFGFANLFQKEGSAEYERAQSWEKHKIFLIIVIALIIGLRFYLADTYTGNIFKDSTVVSLLVVATVFAFTYMVTVAIRMQREATRQRTRRHQAEFRYMTLKHQVNPHFLFNSLNVLDSIVQDGSREEASAYIHKMATIYRYLVKQEGERLVSVAEEVEFTRNYRELMQIRFPEGLTFINHGIPDNPPQGYIVPCTLQLLLENAIKHNAFSASDPLIIEVSTDGKSISMENSLKPKAYTKPSTGIGLQYIRNQYRDIAGAEIKVEKTDTHFKVTLPILPNPN
ncbi:MAG: sensor histidine kinase [Bacteroidales bacterium]|nr:sensor histidine kinase [Bacteroidales bacterium]